MLASVIVEYPHVQGAMAAVVAGLIYIVAHRVVTGTWQ